MKIYKVKIENFRSILNASFFMEEILAIVGQNSSGKSSVISALESFFHPEKQIENYLNDDNLCGLPHKKPRITIIFSDITYDELSNFISENKITIRQTFAKTQLSYEIFNPSSNKFEKYTGKITKYIDFVVIPITRLSDIDSETLTPNSIVYKAIEESLKKLSEKRDTLSGQLKKAYEIIEKRAFSKIEKEINKYYFASGVEAKIKNIKDLDSTILMPLLGIKIIEKGNSYKIKMCGSGSQSLFVIGIYQYLSEQLGIDYIIAIEEPETNLHPQAQRQFINAIIKKSSTKNQIILSTHSPFIVDQLKHEKILLVKKVNNDKREFETKIIQLSSTFFDDYNLNRCKYYESSCIKNSDLFFASSVIITEGITDRNIVELIGEKNGIDLLSCGVSIIVMDGVNNCNYIYSILNALEIPTYWIFDKDFFVHYKNDNNKEKSRDANGFFQYKSTWTPEKNRFEFIKKIIPNEKDRDSIISNLNKKHTAALEKFFNNNIICMRYNAEMDVYVSSKARNEYYKLLNIPPESQNTKYLLENTKNANKDPRNLYDVVDKLDAKNMPYSFRYILKLLRKISTE